MQRVKRIKRKERVHGRTRPQLLTRAELDGRTTAAKTYDRLEYRICQQLGGYDAITELEHLLVEAVLGSSILMKAEIAQLLLGKDIDRKAFHEACQTIIKSASRLGLQRRARDVTPSLSQYLASSEAAE